MRVKEDGDLLRPFSVRRSLTSSERRATCRTGEVIHGQMCSLIPSPRILFDASLQLIRRECPQPWSCALGASSQALIGPVATHRTPRFPPYQAKGRIPTLAFALYPNGCLTGAGDGIPTAHAAWAHSIPDPPTRNPPGNIREDSSRAGDGNRTRAISLGS